MPTQDGYSCSANSDCCVCVGFNFRVERTVENGSVVYVGVVSGEIHLFRQQRVTEAGNTRLLDFCHYNSNTEVRSHLISIDS